MNVLIILLHVIASVALIAIVLLQTGKGAEMGAAFGGASQTLFGGSGSSSFLSKLTTGAAVVFMITCLVLSYRSSTLSVGGGRSIMPETSTEAPKAEPAAPQPVLPEARPVQPETPSPAQQPSAQQAPPAQPAPAQAEPQAQNPADKGQPAQQPQKKQEKSPAKKQ